MNRAIVTLTVLALSSLSASAAPITWSGTNNTSWTTLTNWSTGAIPTIADDITFGAGGSTFAGVDNTFRFVNSITFNRDADFQISGAGNYLGIASGITVAAQAGSRTFTIGGGAKEYPILVGNNIWDIAANQTLYTSDGILANCYTNAAGVNQTSYGFYPTTFYSLTKRGAGTWKASPPANRFMIGQLNVEAGTVDIWSDLHAYGGLTGSGLITSSSAGAVKILSVEVPAGATTVFSGAVTGNAVLSMGDAGTLKYTGTQYRGNNLTMAGTTTAILYVRQGTFELDNSASVETNRLIDVTNIRGQGSGRFLLTGGTTDMIETVGTLDAFGGLLRVEVSGGAGNTTLQAAGLSSIYGNGGMINFVISPTATPYKRVKLTTGTTTDGLLGAAQTAYAIVGGSEFAGYDATNGVIPLPTGHASRISAIESSSATTNLTVNGGTQHLDTTRTVNTMRITDDSGVDLQGYVLTLDASAIIQTGANNSTGIYGGTLKSNGAAYPLYLYTDTDLYLNAYVNTGTTYNLTKAGPGKLTIASAFSKGIAWQEGSLDYQSPQDTVISSFVSGSGTLRMASTYTLGFDPGNYPYGKPFMYAGGTIIDSGTVRFGAAGAAAIDMYTPLGTGPIWINAGGKLLLNSPLANTDIRLNGGTFEWQASSRCNVPTEAVFTLQSGSVSNFSLPSGVTKTVYSIAGGGDLRKINPGTLAIGAGPTYNFANAFADGGVLQLKATPADASTASYNFGSNNGAITAKNGNVFEVNVQPVATGAAGATTVTNPLVVDATGGVIAADFTKLTKVTFSGPVTVNGPAFFGQYDSSTAYAAAPMEFTGTVTINALTAVSSYRAGVNANYQAGATSVDLSAPIVSGTYPVILRALERSYGNQAKGLLNVYGNKDYSTGTVIEESSSYSMYAPPNMLYGEVAAGTTARLGSGNVLVLPGARFRASATTNIDPTSKVQVRSSNLAMGEFNLEMLNADGSMMDSLSSGIFYISQNTNAVTSLASLGNGQMFLGARYTGTTYNIEQVLFAPTLQPCSDDVYRFTARSSYSNVLRIGGTGNNAVLSDTTGHIRSVQVGSNKINGGIGLGPNNSSPGVVRLDGDFQTYSGGTDVVGQTLQNQLAGATTNGTPFGTGAVRLHGGGISIAYGTGGGMGNVSSLSFEGGSWVDAGNSAGSGFTINTVALGSATRVNSGVLYLQGPLLGASTGIRGFVKIASNAPAYDTNQTAAMVAPYFLTNTGTVDFVDYGANGFGRVAYTASNSDVATWNMGKIAALPISTTSTLTANTDIWAIRVMNTVAAPWSAVQVNSNRLTIGSGGLILGVPCNLIGTNTFGGTLRFGSTLADGANFVAKEAVIYVGDPGSNSGRTAIVYPQITAAAGVTKVGWGGLKLANSTNSFTGDINVLEGTLEFDGTNDDGTFGTTTNKIILDGGALQMVPSGATGNINREIVIGDLNGAIGVGNTSGKTLTLNGNITDTGNRVGILNICTNIRATENFTGGGLNTFVFNGAANSYAGGTFIQGQNIVQVGAASSLGGGDVAVGFGSTLTLQGVTNIADTARMSVAQGGAINFQGASETISNLGGSGSVVLGGAADTALTFGDASDATFYGQISQAAGRTGSVTKTGAGAFTFVGPQAFTGPMTVNQGTLNLPSTASLAGGASASGTSTLNVLGRIAAAVTLNDSALLTGSGTIAGLLTANGGTVKPSGLTVGSLAMLPAATFQSDVAGASSYHSLIVTGAADLGSANLAVNLNYAPTLGDSYTLVDNRGPNAITGTFASLAQGQLLNKSYSGTRYWLQMSYTGGTGNDAVLQAVATPLAVLSGVKFNDIDHNGSQGTGELGLAGWTINLDLGGVVSSTTTDATGAYVFSLANLAAATSYTLTETLQTGWTQTAPTAGNYTGTIDAGQTIGGCDFGNYVAVTDIPGDINRDHIVDQADYTVWYNHYGQTPATWSDGDVTGDNIVDQADYTVWYNHYGQTGGNVPEPMTMALLAIGGLGLLRRRK